MALTRIPSFTIDTTSNFTFANVTITSNIEALNANLSNTVVANYFVGNGSSLSSLAGANVTGQVGNALVAGTVYTAAQPNITSVGTLTSLSITGNLTSGNANLGNAATANFFIGNGSLLTGLPASYANSNVASYLPTYTGNITAGNANLGNSTTSNYFTGVLTTSSQPNITSVGTLTSLSVTGNITSGNATLGNLTTSNYFSGSGNNLSNIQGANVSGQVGNALISGTVYTAAQPNITSVGTLTSLTVTGNITGGNLIGPHANGTSNINIPSANGNINLSAAGNANILIVTGTGVNVAGTLNVSGITSLGPVGNVKITGGASNQLLQTDGTGNVSWVTPTGTIITVDNFTADGTLTAFTLSVTPVNKSYTMVSLAGTFQPKSVYSLSGNVITFSSAPPATAPIEITTFSSTLGFGTSDITANSFTANTVTANTLTGNVISSNSNLTVNTLTANSVVNGGSGTPTLQSNTSIVLSASTVVRVSTSPMQFYNCTTTVRDAIAASNGYVIYNTTTNKLQVYANGTWADLH